MKPYVVIITGMSGSGKTTYLKALEDAGFYAMDNMPLEMIPDIISHISRKNPEIQKFALVVDVREEDFQEKFSWLLERLYTSTRLHVVFLDSSDEELTRRFKVMRRKHPLEDGMDLEKALREERRILEGARERAETLINTTGLSPGELRKMAVELHLKGRGKRIILLSFGFSSGIPQEADFVFDLRALPNPYWDERLRPLTGKDREVEDFLLSQKEVQNYLSSLKDFLKTTVPIMFEDGRFQLVIALGCTGGRHRSVFFVEALYNWFMETWKEYEIEKKHREIEGR